MCVVPHAVWTRPTMNEDARAPNACEIIHQHMHAQECQLWTDEVLRQQSRVAAQELWSGLSFFGLYIAFPPSRSSSSRSPRSTSGIHYCAHQMTDPSQGPCSQQASFSNVRGACTKATACRQAHLLRLLQCIMVPFLASVPKTACGSGSPSVP